tara:strand:- start:1595 stop:2101 length:507 start_codon:yes stop_codon:yes gene_type:complete
MTITMQDIRRHDNKTTNHDSLYCPKKNKAAYEMSIMEGKKRPDMIEGVICDKIQEHGYRAHTNPPNHPWDITVSLDDKPVRVEVKSALHSGRIYDTSYSMQNIKPKNFDYLFIVLVTPNGTIIKWAYGEDIKNIVKQRTRHANGFQLNIHKDKIPDCFYDFDDFPYGD